MLVINLVHLKYELFRNWKYLGAKKETLLVSWKCVLISVVSSKKYSKSVMFERISTLEILVGSMYCWIQMKRNFSLAEYLYTYFVAPTTWKMPAISYSNNKEKNHLIKNVGIMGRLQLLLFPFDLLLGVEVVRKGNSYS